MNMLTKIATIFVVISILVSLLLSVMVTSRHRSKVLYCRNNLHRLGQDARKLIQEKSYETYEGDLKTGRAFWQICRELYYSDGNGGWVIREGSPDPFHCPVLGTTISDYADVHTIDYAGPKKDPLTYNISNVFAADRPGNHGPEGTMNVLYLDGHVADINADIQVEEKTENEVIRIQPLSESNVPFGEWITD